MSVELPSGEADDADVVWFERLFASTYDDLLRYAARRVGLTVAPDVAAEVFLTAWRRRNDYHRDDARLWLFGVARLTVANADRSERRAQRLSARAAYAARAARAARGGTEVPDPADSVAAQMRVRDVIAELPPAEAEALRLVAWDGFDLAEAAMIAGCSRATFRVRLFRARRRAAILLSADTRRADSVARADAPPAAEGSASL